MPKSSESEESNLSSTKEEFEVGYDLHLLCFLRNLISIQKLFI